MLLLYLMLMQLGVVYNKCYPILSGYWVGKYAKAMHENAFILHFLSLEIVTEHLEVLQNEVADVLLKE